MLAKEEHIVFKKEASDIKIKQLWFLSNMMTPHKLRFAYEYDGDAYKCVATKEGVTITSTGVNYIKMNDFLGHWMSQWICILMIERVWYSQILWNPSQWT